MSQNQISNLEISLKGLLLIAIIFIGCKDDEPNLDCASGTLFNETGFDGCGWVIQLDDDTTLEPINLDDFEIELTEGLPVCVEYIEVDNLFSICMVGRIVEITSIIERT
ncbi:MAG: hypothetical protein R8G66_33105 [Cytophagales bacterium]|nr:hypothetical protein [Cytophagales bacterium]